MIYYHHHCFHKKWALFFAFCLVLFFNLVWKMTICSHFFMDYSSETLNETWE